MRSITILYETSSEKEVNRSIVRPLLMDTACRIYMQAVKGNPMQENTRKILCIKLLREETEIGLREAKEIIEFIEDMMNLLRSHKLEGLVNPLP